MRLNLSRPRATPRLSHDDYLIPLINVVFLMLIFFMIAGQIAPPDALRIEPPTSRHGRLAPPEQIALMMDAEGRLALDGKILAPESMTEHLAKRLREAGAGGAASGVTLKADASINARQLRAVLGTLRELGVERVRLLAQQQQR